MTAKERPSTCHGCRHLRYESYGASGGGWYTCAKAPGIVLADTGWWEDDTEPRPLEENCYEPREAKA